MTTDLIIVGTGGNAYDILDIVEAINAVAPRFNVAGFLDDVRPIASRHLGHVILGRLADAFRFSNYRFINAIGSDRSFRQRQAILETMGVGSDHFVTLVHPHASVSSRARLGGGVCVNFGVSIAGNVSVGDHVSFGAGCIVGHDTTIDDYTAIAPGAVISGSVRVGRSCYIGSGAHIRQQVCIGDGALVGMGAVVLNDVPAGATVVGNPARLLVRSSELQNVG